MLTVTKYSSGNITEQRADDIAPQITLQLMTWVSCLGAPVWLSAVPFPNMLPANEPGKAEAAGQSAPAPAAQVKELD